MAEKSLHNSNVNGAKKNVSDLKVYGNGDLWKLLSKASSEAEGWMKSTKVMEVAFSDSSAGRIKDPIRGTNDAIPGVLGCMVQVTTQQRNPDGSYAVAEAVTYVPGATFASFDFPKSD